MASIYLTGPQGPQGAQGAQGPAGSGGGGGGSQGSQGAQGSAGAQGYQGSAGAQGYQGSVGIGTQGSVGAQGAQGSAGSQGSDGAQGYQGSVGVGTQGFQGSFGAQGFQGDSASGSETFAGTYTSTYVLKRTTIGAVTGSDSELTIDGSAPTSGNIISLSNNSTSMFDITLVARRTDSDGEGAAYKISVVLERNSNAASTSIIGGDYKVIVAEDSSSWDAVVSANTVDGALKLTISGEAGKTIKWIAFVREIRSIE